MVNSPKYQTLSQETQNDHSWRTQPRWQEQRSWLRAAAMLFAGAVLASMLWTIGLFFHSESPFAQPQPGLRAIPSTTFTRHCGSTPNEARMNGCQFQLWSYSWVPAECFDHDLQKSFLEIAISSSGWSYYSSPRGADEDIVGTGVVMGGGKNHLYTTWGQHYWHCVFYQRKFFSMVLANEGMDLDMMTSRDRDEPHALSCQRWLADPNAYGWKEVNVNLTIGYHSC